MNLVEILPTLSYLLMKAITDLLHSFIGKKTCSCYGGDLSGARSFFIITGSIADVEIPRFHVANDAEFGGNESS